MDACPSPPKESGKKGGKEKVLCDVSVSREESVPV